jgi:hypothetical protein
LPCILFYSRFDAYSDHLYAVSLIAFMVFGMIISVYKWVQFDLLRKKRELYEDKKKKYSKIFFNIWDWKNTGNQYEALSLRSGIRVELKTNLEEDRIKQIINQRTTLEKSRLFIIRLVTLLLNTFILIAGWGGIIALQIYNSSIQTALNKVKYLNYVSKFVPQVGITVINAIVEIFIKKITTLEAWDFKEQLI